jgi:hypothetical protein
MSSVQAIADLATKISLKISDVSDRDNLALAAVEDNARLIRNNTASAISQKH